MGRPKAYPVPVTAARGVDVTTEILVVDDEPDIGAVIAFMLESEGYKVRTPKTDRWPCRA